MDLSESTQLKGHVTMTIRDKDGNAKSVWQPNKLGFALLHAGLEIRIPFLTGNYQDTFETDNLIVNDGLTAAVDSGGVNVFDYLALGTDSTSPTASDSALGSELSSNGLSRTQGSVSQITTNVSNDTHEVTNTFTYTASSSTAVEEVGLFEQASGGTMFARALTGTKTVNTNGETIDVTYEITAS